MAKRLFGNGQILAVADEHSSNTISNDTYVMSFRRNDDDAGLYYEIAVQFSSGAIADVKLTVVGDEVGGAAAFAGVAHALKDSASGTLYFTDSQNLNPITAAGDATSITFTVTPVNPISYIVVKVEILIASGTFSQVVTTPFSVA